MAVTVDPHRHRVATLDQVLAGRRGIAVSASALLGDWAAQHAKRPIRPGPDEEAAQWVDVAARVHGLEHAVCRKVRAGNHAAAVALPDIDLRGRAVVLIDDVATGRTLIAAAEGALARGASTVEVALTHARFVGDAWARSSAAGVRHV